MRFAPAFIALFIALTGPAALAGNHGEHGDKFIPILKDAHYTFQPTVALMTDTLDQDIVGDDSDTVTGIELGINCLC